jgi:LmbE family N-acetylglucosaminyl deacetylase
MNDPGSTVLVVAAHPDDEVLGCGGTMSRLGREGHRIHVVVLGEGVTARHRNRGGADPALLEALQSASRRAAEALGATEVRHFGLADNRFDTIPLLEIVHLIEGVVRDVRPAVVYSHHPGDLNVDHQITSRAVLTGTRPVLGCPVRDLYAFEVPSSTEWAFGMAERGFRPNVFVDVTASLETKIEAMAMYEDEVRTWPHPRSSEALRAIARRWGSVCGLDYAEAFELVRSVR